VFCSAPVHPAIASSNGGKGPALVQQHAAPSTCAMQHSRRCHALAVLDIHTGLWTLRFMRADLRHEMIRPRGFKRPPLVWPELTGSRLTTVESLTGKVSGPQRCQAESRQSGREPLLFRSRVRGFGGGL